MTGIVINNTIIMIIILISVSGWIVAGMVFEMIVKHIPDWRVFVASSKKNLPVLAVLNTGTRKVKLYLGKKRKAEDMIFEVPGYPGFIDPSEGGAGDAIPEIWGKNTQIIHYATDQPLPLSDRNARAISTVIKTVRTNLPRLDFLSDEQVIELLGTERNHLEHDAEMMLKTMKEECDFVEDVDMDELVNLIVAAQEITSRTPVELGVYSYIHAYKKIAYAYTTQYLKHFEMLTIRKTDRKKFDETQRLMIFFLGFVMIVVGGAVGYTMVT